MDRTGVTKVFLVYLVIGHLNLYENMYSGVFEVADNKSAVRFSKLKMANRKWRTLFDKFTISLIKLNIRVADYESEVEFIKILQPYWIRHFEF